MPLRPVIHIDHHAEHWRDLCKEFLYSVEFNHHRGERRSVEESK